ncbi:MAG TPA: prepilin peptidase [Pirellulales bacterium]|jgi:leader peptidase (prepilin peptidase)/N-methyltransferase
MAVHPGFTLVWLFVLGTCIGSFLNVVIYRLPRKISLILPGSHCPNCKHAIRGFDNIPLLSWLWLGRKCRDCNAPISARYPLVELTVGLMFALFAWVDWVQPELAAIHHIRAEQKIGAEIDDAEISVPHAENIRIHLAYHLLLLCPLLAAVLIDFDDQKLPRQLITYPCGAGILLAMFWPDAFLQALVWPRLGGLDGNLNVLNSVLNSAAAVGMGIVGLGMAGVLRIGTQRMWGPLSPRELGLRNATLAMYAVGAFLGWIAVIVIGNLTMLWALAGQNPAVQKTIGRVKPTAVVFVSALVWCALEGTLSRWFFG